MSAITYSKLALNWKPESKNNRQFIVIAIITVITMMLLGIAVSWVKVPEQTRQARVDVPERIANFILEKEKPEVKPKVKPKPVVKPKPKPKPEPEKKEKPKVSKKVKKEPKPALTKTQQQAREKASKSGLLALGNVLADLMETDEVSAMVGGNVKSASNSATKASNSNKAILLANASKGSSGIDIKEYTTTTTTANSSLSQREITLVKQALLSPETLAKVQQTSSTKNKRKAVIESKKPRTAGIRAEEGITVVFDQNKSKLYSIYNRARRKNPNLKGKIVLEITVAPSGKVTRIKVVSNELSDAKLESRLVNRIKQFNFGEQHVEEITVTYPIEFLPA